METPIFISKASTKHKLSIDIAVLNITKPTKILRIKY